MKFIIVEVFIYLFICLFIFDYRALFVCVKYRTCLTMSGQPTALPFVDQFSVSCFVYLKENYIRK